MNEIEAMKAEFAAAKARTESAGETTKPKSIVSDEAAKAKAQVPKPEVEKALPVMPTAKADISYRDPTTGDVRSITVTMRVLLTTDERALLHRVASRLLNMSWENASVLAQSEAWNEAVCRVQWERDDTIPEWFHEAYTSDPDLAAALAREVEVLTEAYFRGHDEEGRVAAPRRFVVKRS